MSERPERRGLEPAAGTCHDAKRPDPSRARDGPGLHRLQAIVDKINYELTGAPKARIVSFPTRQQATGTELLLWLPLSPDPSGLFSVAASIHLSAPTRPVVRRKAGRDLSQRTDAGRVMTVTTPTKKLHGLPAWFGAADAQRMNKKSPGAAPGAQRRLSRRNTRRLDSTPKHKVA
jgi:hypothetical protein